jgi:putative ATP-dependent endonuclease of the OLD family
MIIKRVDVRNFRSLKEASLDCDELTVLVGRNGAGKSSFLYAIDTFYDVAAPITEEDFFNRDLSHPIEIRLTYENLIEDEKTEFSPYIKDAKLIVLKKISLEEGKLIQRYYAAALQIRQFAAIRSKPQKSERIAEWTDLVSRGLLPGLSRSSRSAEEVSRFMDEYEAAHPELMEPIEREVQFFGTKNIGGGKLDNFTKYVLIPAVREVSDEVAGKKGAIYQILDLIVLRKINARDDIRRFKSEFEERARELYCSENLTELPMLGNSISETLEKFAPGAELKLGWDAIRLPEIPIPAAKATLVEDRFEGDISHKGHGLQRALIVTLLQHLALIVPEERRGESAETQEGQAQTLPGSLRVPNLILAFEEPELYLHPARCRYLSNLLLQLAENRTGTGARNQIIYTTHSPYFVDLNRFDKIRMVKKGALPDSTVLQSVVTRYSLELAAEELARVADIAPGSFNRDSFKVRASSVMNTMVNEGFFAYVVVVVEGATEASVLWKLQEIMGKNWPKAGIVIVPAGGKNNIDRPVVIFRGLSIPTYFIFDADAADNREETKKRNHRYFNLANVPLEDFPTTNCHDSWAVFKNNIEQEFKESLGEDVFCTIQNEVATELGYGDFARACKNIEGASRFIELVYEKGNRIKILEDIIEKISHLQD